MKYAILFFSAFVGIVLQDLVVADSAGDLARILGTVPDNIYSNIHHCRAAGYRCKYVKVEVDDDELS